MDKYRIAVIPGDGIGVDTIDQAQATLDVLSEVHGGLALSYDRFPWGCSYYLQNGEMMPADGLQTLGDYDSILFGAVGFPPVPDHISLWGLLIPIRRQFDQYVNLRPCRLLPGAKSPLADRGPADIDFYVVRENTEGEYSSIGGRMFPGTEREFVVQETVMTRTGVDRILKFAFDLAQRRPKKH